MTNETFGGEVNDPQTYFAEIAQDARLQSRHDLACEYVAQRAAEYGFTIPKDRIASLPSVRLAVLAEEPFGAAFERELASLPEYEAARKEKEQAAKVKEGDSEAQAAMARMSPAARMAYARKHGLDRPADAPEDSEALKQTRLEIARGLSPAKRMAYVREHGLAQRR